MLKKAVALVLCAGLAASGCASGGGPRIESSPVFGPNEHAAIAEYVGKLPPGSKVRVERSAGDMVKGTLMKVTDTAVLVQRNTRVPEPPLEIPLDQITRVTIDSGGSTGRSVGIGVAVGVGTFFAIGLILAAILGGD